MTEPISVVRQTTFNTEPPLDPSVSDNRIRRGNIDLPIVDDRQIWQAQSTNRVLASLDTEFHKVHIGRGTRANFSKGPQSSIGDSSELDILSDVGLAGDSDTDTPASIKSALSLSARKKIRKEPRIKVPTGKFDSEEPTIPEETTQDFLVLHTPLRPSRDRSRLFENRSFHRNDTPKATVVDCKKSEPAEAGESTHLTRDNSNVNAPDNAERENTGAGDDEALSGIGSKSGMKETEKSESRLSVEREDLDSSFCESDWQPKRKKTPTITKTIDTAVEADKRVISSKFEKDIKPALHASLDTGKRWTQGKKLVSSEKDAAESLTLSENKVDASETKDNKHSQEELFNKKNVSPRQKTPPRPQTPLVLQNLELAQVDDIDNGAISDWNNDSISGIPKSQKVKSVEKDTAPTQPIFSHPDPNVLQDEQINMATSDGYDYASETFEEVLQERNAMVKAERTYQKRIKQLEEELKAMISQCQTLSDENKELRKELDAAKSKQGEEKAQSEDAQKDGAEAKIAKLESENENLVHINEKLSQKLKDTDTKTKQFDGVFVENTKLKTKNAELERKIQDLQKQLQNEDISTMNRALDAKRKGIEILLEDSQKENKLLTAKVIKLEEQNHSLADVLDEKRKEVGELLTAMNNETTTENELKQSKEHLTRAAEELDSVKREMAEMNKILQESEEGREKFKSVIAQRESEIRKMKAENENKDRLIVDLRGGLEKSRQEVVKHQKAAETPKEMEKETQALKSRIGSLKAEIESSLFENQRLKQERDESTRTIERLKQENQSSSEAVTESKRYFRKWEVERDAKSKCEVDLAKKDEQIDMLDSRLRDSVNRMNILLNRVRALEEERVKLNGTSFQEMEANLKIQRDENKKLRQMLVERNIELTNKKTEQKQIDSRIQILERKQKDSDVRVKQLAGWVGNSNEQIHAPNGPLAFMESEHPNNLLVSRSHPPPQNGRAPGKMNANPRPAPATRLEQPRPTDQPPRIPYNISHRVKRPGQGAKTKTQNSVTPPPAWDHGGRKPLGGLGGDEASTTPLSLPLILDSKSLTPPDQNGGYFRMYQEKMKRMKERQF